LARERRPDQKKKGHGKIGKIETEIAQHLERESRHCCRYK